MSVRERVVRGNHTSEHICQFFDSDETRADAVANYLAEGLRSDEYVIVIARPVSWSAIVERLEAARIPLGRRLHTGKLIVKDAVDTLRRLSPGGSPEVLAFERVVGSAVRDVAELGRVRAYGEMVDILAQRGEMDDAIRLEMMWNHLSERTPFSLMCGYGAAHFVAASTHRSMREICATHSDVRRCEHDPLASWLLTAAHNPIASSSRLSH